MVLVLFIICGLVRYYYYHLWWSCVLGIIVIWFVFSSFRYHCDRVFFCWWVSLLHSYILSYPPLSYDVFLLTSFLFLFHQRNTLDNDNNSNDNNSSLHSHHDHDCVFIIVHYHPTTARSPSSSSSTPQRTNSTGHHHPPLTGRHRGTGCWRRRRQWGSREGARPHAGPSCWTRSGRGAPPLGAGRACPCCPCSCALAASSCSSATTSVLFSLRIWFSIKE